MNTVTQITRRRQAIIEYSIKKGVTAAARRYNVSRQFIYRWKKRYDGTLESLEDRSHRPHSHPNQHTPEEIKLIKDMRKRNMHTGLVVFWVKLRQKRIYTFDNIAVESSEKTGSHSGKAAKSEVYTKTV